MMCSPAFARIVVLWAALLLAAGAAALDVHQATTHYRISTWGVANGLPHASISALFQDRDGYLWVGTYQGAARFDGVRFVALSELGQGEVSPDMIESITQTADGTLWFGGRYRGVSRLKADGSLRQFRVGAGLEHDSVTLLRAHPQGGLWLATATGLFHALPQGETLELRAELPEVVWALAQDRTGRWWAGSENGIWRKDRDRWRRGSEHPALAQAHVWSLVFDDADHGYAGYRGGAAVLHGGGFVPWERDPPLPNPVVRVVLPDIENRWWVGTAGAGLLRLHGQQQELLNRAIGLPSDVVWEAGFDRESNLWVGTAAGLARISDALVLTYGEPEGLPAGLAWSVSPRLAGGWWMGFNGGGLAAFDHGQRVDIAQSGAGLDSSEVIQTVLDLGSEQWLGTLTGLYRRDAGSGAIRPFPGLAGQRVRVLVRADADTMLVGTQQGLFRLRDEVLEPIELPGAATASISRLHSDGPGRWLVAAQSAGLFQLDGGQVRQLIPGSSMPIRDAVRAPDGRIWVAGVGLHVLEQGQLRPVTPINRNLVAQLHAIELDASGRLWASSNAGVLRVELSALARYLNDPAAVPDYVLFGEAEGMRNSECNGGNQHPLALAGDGALWVATTEGVVRIPGDAKTLHAPLPRPRIERLVADGERLDVRGTLQLPAGLRQLVIDYTALRLSDAERLRFRYRLLPDTPGWSDNGGLRSVVVQGLPPGQHRFEVAVATPAEPWSPAVGLDFEILPLWWQRLEVRAAAGTVLLMLAAAFPLWRVRALRQRERELAEQVRARTEDLVAANAALARAASIDFLTGLPNRRAFVQALDKAYASSSDIALAIIDIDHFKAYNDTLGHLAGDECLSVFGRLLRDRAEASGATAARVGGEEFALLLLAGRVAAERLLAQFADELEQRALAHPASSCGSLLSFSAGLALRENHDLRPQDQIARADQALYQAKSQGRKRWVLA